MALKPLRPCRKPGCPELTRNGYCEAHKPTKAGRRESQEWHWMYNTPEWKNDLRPTQLLLEPFCRDCAKEGRRTPATRVDHVEPHRGDWSKFADRKNLQSLCERHHNRKTAQEMADRIRKSRNI